MPMKLYAHPDNYKTKKILICASYAQLQIDTPAKSDDKTAIGKIPVLETDHGCIFASTAIARYVSRIRRDVGLYGNNLIENGMVDSWVEFSTHELEVPLCTWVYPLMGIFEEVPEATKQAKADVTKAFTVLNNHLLHNTYMVGHQMTLADISIVASISIGMGLVFDAAFCQPFPNLVRWFNTCMAQAEFSKILGKIEIGGAAKGKGGAAPKKEQASPKGSPKAAPKKEEKKKEAPKKEAPKKDAAPAKPAGGGGAVDQAAVDACGNEIRVLKEKLKAEGLSGKKINDHAEVKTLVEKLSKLKAGEAVGGGGGGGGGDKAAEDRKKQMKKVIKEGGKRGVEIEGAADMGGLQYFCTSLEEVQGDLEFIEKSMEAMNAKSDPTEEERKGGSGAIGKMIFSAGPDKLAICAYVPDALTKDNQADVWLKHILTTFGGEVVKGTKGVAVGKIMLNGDKNIFPLKLKEPCITEAISYLKKKGLFPDKDDSDDDYVFGDDDFPS